MNEKGDLNAQINEILIEWDPVGIENYPNEIKTEYVRYIPQILSKISDYDQLRKLLWRIGSIDIGTHKDGNREHEEIVSKIATRIYQLKH